MRLITLLGSFAGLLALGAAVDSTQTNLGLTTQDLSHQTFTSEVSSEYGEYIDISSIEGRGPDVGTSPATASLPFPPPVREQSASSPEPPIANSLPEPANLEIDLWSFCPAGVLKILSWAGLCPDHFSLIDVKGVNATGTTITKTAILEPEKLATRPLTSTKISRPIIWQTETIPVVIITTKESILLSTTTIPTTMTETDIETETVTIEAPLSTTTTETKTRTVTEVPATKTKTEKKTQTVITEVSLSVTSTTSVTRTRISTEYIYTTEVETLTEVEATPWNLLRTATVTTTVTETPITTPLPSRITSDLPMWSPRYCGEKAILYPIGMECEHWIKFHFVIHCLQYAAWAVLLSNIPWAVCQMARVMAYWVSPQKNPDNSNNDDSSSPSPPPGDPPPPLDGPPSPPGGAPCGAPGGSGHGAPRGGPPRRFGGPRGLQDLNVFKSAPGSPPHRAGRNQRWNLDTSSQRHHDQIPISQRVNATPTKIKRRAPSIQNLPGRTQDSSFVDLIPLDRFLDSDKMSQAPSNTSNNMGIWAPAYSMFDKTTNHPRRTLEKLILPPPLTPETENRPVLILGAANDGKHKDALIDTPHGRGGESPIYKQARGLVENLAEKVAQYMDPAESRQFAFNLFAALELTGTQRKLSAELMDRSYNHLLGRYPTLLKDSDIREKMKNLSLRTPEEAPPSSVVPSQPVADADTDTTTANPIKLPNLQLVLSRIGNLVDSNKFDKDTQDQMRSWLDEHGDPKDDRDVLVYLFRLRSRLLGSQRDDIRDLKELPPWRFILARLLEFPISDHQTGKVRWDLTVREVQEQFENEDDRGSEGEDEYEDIVTVASSSSGEVATDYRDNGDGANAFEKAVTEGYTDQNLSAYKPEQGTRQEDNAFIPSPSNEPASSPENQDSHRKDAATTGEPNPTPNLVLIDLTPSPSTYRDPHSLQYLHTPSSQNQNPTVARQQAKQEQFDSAMTGTQTTVVTGTGTGTAPEPQTALETTFEQLFAGTSTDTDASGSNTSRRNSSTPRQNPLRKNSSSSNVKKKDALRRVR